MSNIKKQFISIYNIIEIHKDKFSKTLYKQLVDECTSRVLTQTFRTNDEGTLEIFCWYHKEWEDTEIIAYGSKKGTKTGLNTFCKQGVSHWTKQQREFKHGKEMLIEQLMSGDIEQDDLPELMGKLEAKSKVVHPYEY